MNKNEELDFQSSNFNVTTSNYYLNIEDAQSIYQIIKDLTDVLTYFQIPYYISSGTLLGAIRNKGILRWDEDADLQVLIESQNDVKNKVIPAMATIGYEVVWRYFGPKFYLKNGKNLKILGNVSDPWKFPYIDIFFVEKINKKIFFKSEEARNHYPEEYWEENELYPLKLYQFGPLLVYGPNDPIKYLDRSYPNWDKIGVIEVGHGDKVIVMNTELNDEDRKPSPWLKEMENRFNVSIDYIFSNNQ